MSMFYSVRMSNYSFRYEDWLRGWREWARTRKRGKMAQFIVEKLEEGVSFVVVKMHFVDECLKVYS